MSEYEEHMKSEIKIKSFDELTSSELYELLRLRADVFVVEQNCVYNDVDGADYASLHLFTLDESGRCTCCARIYHDEANVGVMRIGRLIAKERGKGNGMRLLLACIEECKNLGAEEIRLHAQQYAIGFYERAGFSVCSEVFLEDGIPHVEMRLARL